MSEYLKPSCANVVITTADTEFNWNPPDTPTPCKNYAFRVREPNVELRYAWTTGKVAGRVAPYMTLPADSVWGCPDRMRNGTDIIYFAADVPCTVEIEFWNGSEA